LTNKKLVGKEIRLSQRPVGFAKEEDFGLVEVEVPELKKKMNSWCAIFGFPVVQAIIDRTSYDNSRSVPLQANQPVEHDLAKWYINVA
jgi:hypothetical protein